MRIFNFEKFLTLLQTSHLHASNKYSLSNAHFYTQHTVQTSTPRVAPTRGGCSVRPPGVRRRLPQPACGMKMRAQNRNGRALQSWRNKRRVLEALCRRGGRKTFEKQCDFEKKIKPAIAFTLWEPNLPNIIRGDWYIGDWHSNTNPPPKTLCRPWLT